MNNLKRRFERSRLSSEQKERIIDYAYEQRQKTKSLVPIVLPSFIGLALLLLFLNIGGASNSQQTTANGEAVIRSTNFYLNTCNMILIVGNMMYIWRLIEGGIWKVSDKVRARLQKMYIFLIIAAIVLYSVVDGYIGLTSYYKEIMFMLLLMMLVTLVIFCKTDAISGPGVVRYPTLLIFSSAILIASNVFLYTIDATVKVNATVTFFGFPTEVSWETYHLGSAGAMLFAGGCVLLIISLKKYRSLTLALIFAFHSGMPQIVEYIQQSYFAKGVEAIAYENDGRCQFLEETQGFIDFHCELTLQNKSKEPVTFELEFVDTQLSEGDEPILEYFNEAGPFVYTLDAHESRVIRIDDQLDMRNSERGIFEGESYINFKLKDEYSVVIY